MKRCRTCGDELVIGENWTLGRARTYNNICQGCLTAWRKTYREANQKKLAIKGKAYYKANREVIAVREKVYREANLEKATARKRTWNRANPERVAVINRTWRKANPEKTRAQGRRRRALHANAEGSFTEAEFRALCEEYGNRCLCCGRTDTPLQRDHVIPLSRGGTDWISNIQPLCQRCNDSKGTKSTDYRTDVLDYPYSGGQDYPSG